MCGDERPVRRCARGSEPSGALALAGMKKYIAQHNIRGERLAHILSGANVNFHGLRYVSERCELGEQREALLAVTIPEEKGSFLKFCQLLGGRSVTEFNYRFADAKNACIFVGVRLSRGLEERKEILQMLNDGGYSVVDLSDDEMAKLHVRYMVGGRPSHPLQERLYSFEFPESPGALLRFLNTLGTHWNISLFHYRSHGTDYGRVLAAFELGDHEPDFETRLNELGYDCHDETNNPAFRFFWRVNGSAKSSRMPQSAAHVAAFSAHTPSSNGVFSSLRSKIITRLRTGSRLFSSTTSGNKATPQPSATIDTIASCPPTVA